MAQVKKLKNGNVLKYKRGNIVLNGQIIAKGDEMTDEYLSTPHTRQTCLRKVLYQSKDCKLSCEYSPVSEGVKRAAADDRIITSQKFKATGFDENTLLYM